MGIWVGRYAMDQGQVREHGPWLVDQRRDRDDGAIRLLVLAEPVDDRPAEFCDEVAEAVAALFGREALSVTGGVLRALRQAHANLAEWNERSLREHHVAVGLTCVAIREGEATIAQLGAGAVYLVRHDDTARRVGTEDLPAALPLGGTEPIEPRFTTAHLDDEFLLLLTSAAEQQIGETAVLESLTAGPERALAELFTRTREVPNMSAVLIADLDIEEDTPPLGEPEELPDPPPPLDSGPLEAAPPAGSAGASTAADASTDPRTGAPAASPLERRRTPAMPSVRRPSRITERSGGHFAPSRQGPPRWAWTAGGAAALIAVVLLGWMFLPALFEQDSAGRLEDALAAAQIHVDEAAAAETLGAEREALLAALQDLEQARAVDAAEPRLIALDTRIAAQLEVLDAVVDVEALRPVLRFAGTVTAPLDPRSITFGGGSLWLMDAEQGRVIRVDPEGAFDPIEVYAATTLYGGRIAAVPLQVTWDQGGDRLLVLDADRQLWSVLPVTNSEPTALTLRDAEELRSIAGIATYVSNLYVLDPESGEVWRYLPAGDGFDSERGGLLGAIELPEATQLIVDGDVYVQDGGTLRRFRQGTEQDSLLDGIDQPPASPSAVVEDVIRGLIFIADRGNGRIVVGDREGPFVRQYHHGGFADLRGLALSGDGAILYVLTADGIDAFSVIDPAS